MTVFEVFFGLSPRKTVWTKRDGEVRKQAPAVPKVLQPRKTIQQKDKS